MLHKLLSRSFGSLFTFATVDQKHDDAPEIDPHQAFLNSIAHLPPEERARRIETRQRYTRFAQHQRLIETESQADSLRNH